MAERKRAFPPYFRRVDLKTDMLRRAGFVFPILHPRSAPIADDLPFLVLFEHFVFSDKGRAIEPAAAVDDIVIK